MGVEKKDIYWAALLAFFFCMSSTALALAAARSLASLLCFSSQAYSQVSSQVRTMKTLKCNRLGSEWWLKFMWNDINLLDLFPLYIYIVTVKYTLRYANCRPSLFFTLYQYEFDNKFIILYFNTWPKLDDPSTVSLLKKKKSRDGVRK